MVSPCVHIRLPEEMVAELRIIALEISLDEQKSLSWTMCLRRAAKKFIAAYHRKKSRNAQQ